MSDESKELTYTLKVTDNGTIDLTFSHDWEDRSLWDLDYKTLLGVLSLIRAELLNYEQDILTKKQAHAEWKKKEDEKHRISMRERNNALAFHHLCAMNRQAIEELLKGEKK